MSTDDLDNGTKTNKLRYAKLGRTINRPYEVIKHFPDAGNVASDKVGLYKRDEDKVELHRLIYVIHQQICKYRFKIMFRRPLTMKTSANWPIRSKDLLEVLTHQFTEGIILNMMPLTNPQPSPTAHKTSLG